MYDELIRAQAMAAEIACERMSPPRVRALHQSLEEACRLPADAGWDRKAAAHAAFFTVMAEAVDDPVVTPVLRSGGQLAYDLMITAGRAADGIVINSRRRFLRHLGADDAEAAVLELEKHLRILCFMCRLASRRFSGRETAIHSTETASLPREETAKETRWLSPP